ncbi:ATP-binding protein [Cellulomonas sp. NPDC055163]
MSSQAGAAGGGAQEDGDLLHPARPPARFEPVRQWVLEALAGLPGLRAGLREQIGTRAHVDGGGPAGDLTSRVVLIASELATNALSHGGAPAVVTLYRGGTRLLLEIADQDPTTQPRIAGDRAPGQGGFGLQIARRLAEDVGWYRTDTGKIVWAEIGE